MERDSDAPEQFTLSDQIDIACDEFEKRLVAGAKPSVEEYLSRIPESGRFQLLEELLALYKEHLLGSFLPTAVQDDTPNPAQASTLGADTVVGPQPTGMLGDYELLEEIARGGMGVVYKARQISLDRVVALKMIKSGEFANQEQVDRFYKEAKAAGNLDHPGIVPVYEVGEVDRQHYFTMGFVDGESLAERLREGPLPPKEAALYAKSIVEALAYAHSKGVIHRDLKPGNVLMTREGQLRITDFGLAKRVGDDSELTSTGQVLGTPSYMPPEQAEGRLTEIGPAADVYAVGATLYCMLVGRPPFQAANVIETIKQVLEADPVPLCQQNGSVPPDLETICLKCLEKHPGKRYSSAQELVNELNRYIIGDPIQARPVGATERTWRWCKRRPIAAALLASVVLLAVSAVTFSALLVVSGNRTARARVNTLLRSTPANIPLILDELDQTHRIVGPELRELETSDLRRSQRVRVSLALVPFDSSQIHVLKNQISVSPFDELSVVLERLKNHGGIALSQELWSLFREPKTDEMHRFRTGLALATLDPDSEQWQENDYAYLASQMLSQNTLHQPAIRKSLMPVAHRLVPSLLGSFERAKPGTLIDESSANAILDFASDRIDLLMDLSCRGTPNQHAVLFPAVVVKASADQAIMDKLIATTKLQPKDIDNEVTRIELGRKKAGAGINLVLMDRYKDALEVLRVREDPESLTQFIHGIKDRGITVDDLLNLLNLATTVTERYAILLGLGEFDVTEIPAEIRETWVAYVVDLYANDPSSGIHGASGWLLRQWGVDDQAKSIDQREVAYSKDREWFTLKINMAGPGNPEWFSYFTFVVFPKGIFQLGAPQYEVDRFVDEKPHNVELSNGFALLDREISRAEYEAFDNRFMGTIAQYSPTGDSAMIGPSWYDAVRFCRWLTIRSGMETSDQCYGEPSAYDAKEIDPNPAADGMPQNWVVERSRSGFRLPTESEWEIACRSGALSRFGFGCEDSYLDHYAWHQENSSFHAHIGRVLRPNLRGVFDMHGNVFEWCHDWHGDYYHYSSDRPDPLGSPNGVARVHRGGSFSVHAAICRSAQRSSTQPANRSSGFGFRIALIPHDIK